MSRVRVLVGTRKGAFILTSDGRRDRWDVSGPHFAGWEIYHLKGSPADPDRLYASQSSGWFGQIIQRSDDGGRTWAPPGGGPTTTPDGMPMGRATSSSTTRRRDRQAPDDPPVVRRHAAPLGVQARLAPRAVADRPGHRLRGRRGRRPVPLGRRRPDLAGARRASRATSRARAGSPAPAGCACTRSSSTRAIPGGSSSRSRPPGVFRTDDGGQTWRPKNRGLRSQYIPDPDAEVGHCVHRIAMHPSRPDVLFMQKHWDVMRSDDAGESWREVSGNLPTDFGFPIDVHAHEPETVYVVPIKSDSEHYPPEGKLRVYRSRTGGDEWEPLTEGLPQARLLRQRPARRHGRRPARPVRRLLRHHRAARSTPRPTPATAGRPSSATSRPSSPSRSRRSHDPRRAPIPPADPGRSRRRGGARRRGPGDASARSSTRSRPATRCSAGRSATTTRSAAGPFLRFFACERDLSHEPPDAPLPDAVADGREPFLVVGAIAGG